MSTTWKETLTGRMPEDLAREVEIFETQIELRKQGKMDEKIFAETRLRRGAYGQRYDNGQRHDGEKTQKIPFRDLTKGPETFFDAPGMIRIKIPYGGVTPDQLEELANISEEYSVSVIHITTRQDFQMHYLHMDNIPDVMYRLASVGITTREACGNSVRNVTGCPYAGVCRTEAFDVTPYAGICAQFLLGHEDCQDFGRKFKIAFSGCEENPCALVAMHDMGAIARVRDGKRGFGLFVGGGLGAVPQQAKEMYEFLPQEELLKVSVGICRVFARLGEKKNRARARVKFLVQKLGIEEFKRLVEEELAILPHDERWVGLLKDVDTYSETPLKSPMSLNGANRPEGFDAWYKTNAYRQKQDGYVGITVRLPLGDERVADAPTGRRVPEILRRQHSHHGGAEFLSSLDQRSGRHRPLYRFESHWPRRWRRALDRGYHRVPRNGFLQARDILQPRTRSGTDPAAREGRGGFGSDHQGPERQDFRLASTTLPISASTA